MFLTEEIEPVNTDRVVLFYLNPSKATGKPSIFTHRYAEPCESPTAKDLRSFVVLASSNSSIYHNLNWFG